MPFSFWSHLPCIVVWFCWLLLCEKTKHVCRWVAECACRKLERQLSSVLRTALTVKHWDRILAEHKYPDKSHTSLFHCISTTMQNSSKNICEELEITYSGYEVLLDTQTLTYNIYNKCSSYLALASVSPKWFLLPGMSVYNGSNHMEFAFFDTSCLGIAKSIFCYQRWTVH